MKLDNTENSCEDMNWIHLAQDRIQLRALVNLMMSLDSVIAGDFVMCGVS